MNKTGNGNKTKEPKGGTRELEIARPNAGALQRLQTPGTIAHAFSKVGGVDTAIAYARLAAPSDARIAQVVETYEGLAPAQQEATSIEELCQQFGIPPDKFLGALASAAYRYNVSLTSFIAAIHQPEVVERLADLAMLPENHDDRRLFLTGTGFAPSPKGPSIVIANQAASIPQSIEQLIRASATLVRQVPDTGVVDAETEEGICTPEESSSGGSKPPAE